MSRTNIYLLLQSELIKKQYYLKLSLDQIIHYQDLLSQITEQSKFIVYTSVNKNKIFSIENVPTYFLPNKNLQKIKNIMLRRYLPYYDNYSLQQIY